MKKSLFTILLALLPLLASADAVEINGICYNLVKKAKTAEVTSTPDSRYSGKVVIPKTVTYEGVKYSVTSIGVHAFYNCSGLTSVTVGGNVTSIGNGAFMYCNYLESVTIPNSVTSIGDLAFKDCYRMTSITIGSGVTSIGSSAFSGCRKLSSVHITDLEAGCKISFLYNGSNPLTYAHHLYLKDTEIKDLVIPNTVTSIGYNAFCDCSGLTSVNIPTSVTSIGYEAFIYCSGLTSVTIGSGVTSIESGTFSACSSLKSVTIGNSVASIGSDAFCNCTSLKSITIPSSVTSIGSDAFGYCSGLTSVTISNGVTIIDGFAGCSSLTSITIPNSVTEISGSAFSGCSSLTSITIPNSVTEISGSAFSGCSGLTTVSIGNGIQKIYSRAFADCVELVDVYCYAENVPETSEKAFENSLPEYITLHVPVGSLDAYKAATPWSQFKSKVKITSKVSLSKTEVDIEKGKTVTLKATVTPSTLLDKSVTWKSSNTKIATVTSSGKVKGVKGGTATITCTSKVSGTKATCKVTVIEGGVTLDKTEVTLQKGKTVTLKATVEPSTLEDKSVTWTSSNTKIATVTSAGKVKGVKAGTATITCTSVATGLSATCKVTVINGTITLNKTEAYLEKGKTLTLKATLTPTDLEDKSVTWTSSDTKIATVSSSGKVKGVKYGTATITCTSNATGVSATCQVTVGKVVISMSEFSIKKSRAITLEAAVYPSTLSDKSVTWVSSDTQVATVSSSGRVKGIKAGTTTITCTSNATGLSATCTVTVLSTSESRSVEGDDDNVTGIESIEEALEPYDVYDLSGRKVRHQVTSLDGLPAGVYIVNGKKVLKK